MNGRIPLIASALFLPAACSKDDLTPSFSATIYYAAGGSNRLAGSRPSWHFDPALPNHSSGIRIVATPDTVRSLPSSLPQLADFEVWVTGSAATRFPTLIGGNVPILNGPDSLFTVAAGRVFPYGADSGTVHVTPVGGNAVHVNFDVWFGSGEGLPEFRLVGSLVAAPQL